MIGEELSTAQFSEAGHSIVDFLDTLSEFRLAYQEVTREEAVAFREASKTLAGACRRIDEMRDRTSVGQLMRFYSSNPLQVLSHIIALLGRVNKLAINTSTEMERSLRDMQPPSIDGTVDIEALRARMSNLESRVETLGGAEK